MTDCVVGRWRAELDAEDTTAFTQATTHMSRADLYGAICAATRTRPFSLTALKDCINKRCVCNREDQ